MKWHLRITAAVAGLALGLSAVSLAQARPDFTGTWVVEEVDAPQRGGGRGGGRRAGGGGRAGRGGGRAALAVQAQPGQQVVISQTEERLIVTMPTDAGETMSSYPFDGSEASNPAPGGGTVTSRSTWKGVALVTTTSSSISAPRGNVTITSREVRRLSEDGQTMTLTTTRSAFQREFTTTVTLTKAEG